MVWKAWIAGHSFDLETLAELFKAGDPLIAQVPSEGYYLESPVIGDSSGQPDLRAADALVKCINGVGRATERDYGPVRLTGRYTAPDGATSFVVSADTAEARARATVGTVLSAGTPAPGQPPKGPRYVSAANRDSDVADALRILGQPEPLDWYDIYKTWEIVASAVGGAAQVNTWGWATTSDIERLKASANHPGVSGDSARHARARGRRGRHPSPGLAMSMSEADGMIRRLVASWIESLPDY